MSRPVKHPRPASPPTAEPALPAAEAAAGAEGRAASERRLIALRWLLAMAALTLLNVGAFGRIATQDFVHFDDDLYIYENARVSRGLTAQGLRWAFSLDTPGQYHPLTWLSHMADVSLWGLRPGAHKLHNLGLHLASAGLLMLLVQRITGRLTWAFAAAAIWSVHPLRVEAVAWASQRKELLAGCLGLASLLAYLAWGQRGGGWRYGLALGLFALAALAKPVVVALPGAMLLMDVWPLRRLGDGDQADLRRRVARLLLEKAPFFAVSAACVGLAVLVARGRDALAGDAADVSLPMRLLHAVGAYGWYLWKSVAPLDLAATYAPHDATPWGLIVAGAVSVVGVTLLAWRFRRAAPAVMLGWLIFLGVMVPMLKIVAVGVSPYADRFAYLPHIGLALATVAGVGALVDRLQGRRLVAAALLLVVLVTLTTLTERQTRAWDDSLALFTQAVRVNPANSLAQGNLGVALMEAGEDERAIRHFEIERELEPDRLRPALNLSRALTRVGRMAEARRILTDLARRFPEAADVWADLAPHLFMTGQADDGWAALDRALELDPDLWLAHLRMGIAHEQAGDVTAAAEAYERAGRLQRHDAEPWRRLGQLMARAGRLPEAQAAFERAQSIERSR